MRTNIHAISGIRTHGLSIQAIKVYASDRMATETGKGLWHPRFFKYLNLYGKFNKAAYTGINNYIVIIDISKPIRNSQSYTNTFYLTKYIYNSDILGVCVSIFPDSDFGHVMVQAVSRRSPTAENRVCTRVSPRGICGGQSSSEAGFTPTFSVLTCHCHSTMTLHTHVSSRGWTIGPLLASVHRHSLASST
jgi:hypothetical protein